MKNKIVFALITIFLLSCQSKPVAPEDAVFDAKEERTQQQNTEIPPAHTPPAAQTHTVTFAAVGDNLFHESLINAALKEDGTYDFSPLYTEIKPIIQKADLAFINQETVMAGERFGYSGYPQFNTPQSLARTHVETGFDIMNLANNHAMDKGRDGLYATLDFLSTIPELTVIGARKEGPSARIVTKNNITFGFLSYTFSLNGIALPRDNPNLVSMIDRHKMTHEIHALRPLCDFLIVSMHWGDEYQLEPNREQINLARFLADHNVDLIIGHHPHVLQRADKLPRHDGKETYVFYSLGNFASHQRERERIIGGMMILTFKKTGEELSITDFAMIPVITHYDRNFRNTKLYPLYAYTEELLANHRLKNEGPGLSMDFFRGVTNRLNVKIITQNPFNH